MVAINCFCSRKQATLHNRGLPFNTPGILKIMRNLPVLPGIAQDKYIGL